MDRAGLVGEDGETHMGLYDIAYMLSVPGMTVAAPKDGAEMLGLLRAAVDHTDGPFCFRYPRDASPDIPGAMSEITATPYATWEVVRQGRDFAILAVGTMVNQALAAADLLAADGMDVSVVNCRYMKPYDEVTLNAILASHTHVLTVEEGTIVNGFGSFISSVIHRQAPTVRTAVHGVPDRIIYSAPRKKQLAALGLDPAGIADRVRAMHDSEALAS